MWSLQLCFYALREDFARAEWSEGAEWNGQFRRPKKRWRNAVRRTDETAAQNRPTSTGLSCPVVSLQGPVGRHRRLGDEAEEFAVAPEEILQPGQRAREQHAGGAVGLSHLMGDLL